MSAVASGKPAVFLDWNSAAGQFNTIDGALTGTNTIASAGGGGFPGLFIATTFSNPGDTATLLSDGTRFDAIDGQAIDSIHASVGTVNLTLQDNLDTNTAAATTRVFFISNDIGTTCLTMTGNNTDRGGGVPGDNIELLRLGGIFTVTDLSALGSNNNNITTQIFGNPSSVTEPCILPELP